MFGAAAEEEPDPASESAILAAIEEAAEDAQ